MTLDDQKAFGTKRSKRIKSVYRNRDDRALPYSAMPMKSEKSLSARRLYFDLLEKENDPVVARQARAFLTDQLERIAGPSDLPEKFGELETWLEEKVEKTGLSYREYVAGRQQGAGRRYFSSKSHALYFLQAVAPTKLVDGAWLYGVTRAWRDNRYRSLIRIYLEELGGGDPARNHVLLYRNLLAAYADERWRDLDDEHFVQGAIQLAFSRNAQYFLPELIGFNLGYEQLPLHLPITAFELKELGIDPYYFTLHVTIDNAASGHARQALQAARDAMPIVGSKEVFYERMVRGYRLNDSGAGTESLIASFDMNRELIDVFKRKSVFGKNAHADYCKIGGRALSDWLADPANIPQLLNELERLGWIKRHQDPAESRFWKLLQGNKAQMFGVFNHYELQLIHDWIAGDLLSAQRASGAAVPGYEGYRSRPEKRGVIQIGRQAANDADLHLAEKTFRGDSVLRSDDFDEDARALREKIAALDNENDLMDTLAEYLSPGMHHSAPGLFATRLFAKALALS